LRPRGGGSRCTTNRGAALELLAEGGSGATHQTGETSPSDVDSSDGRSFGGGGVCVLANTVKFAVVRRGSWLRCPPGAQERTRPPREEEAVELATRDSVAVGEVRAGRGGEEWCLEDTGESEVIHAVGYCGVRMRLDGEVYAARDGAAGGGMGSTPWAQRETRSQEE